MAELDAIFRALEDEQIARLEPFAQKRQFQSGELLFNQGDGEHGVFVILSGSADIIGPKGDILRHVEPKMFTGEVNLLSGRRSLILCRACEATSALEISRANLRQIINSDAELSEIFLRAFLLAASI